VGQGGVSGDLVAEIWLENGLLAAEKWLGSSSPAWHCAAMGKRERMGVDILFLSLCG